MTIIDRFEAAEMLRVWPRTIQKWASDGTISVAAVVCNEATKGRPARMYDRTEIEALYEELYPVISVSPEFGHWLCGFIDGEGSFWISPRHERGIDCRFAIVQRADNKAVLEKIRDELGVGTVRPGRSPNGSKPIYEFTICRKWECMAFVHFIEKHGLFGKKQEDFQLWAEGVRVWCASGRCRDGTVPRQNFEAVMGLKKQLAQGRKYIEEKGGE